MSFTITAELPLGTYRGASADGRPEPLPSVARLHSALLCAAGFGPRAVPAGDTLAPCRADEAALRWLEEHPPDGVVIPALAVNRGAAVAYRDDGTIKQAKGRGTTKKLAKVAGTAVAVAGRFAWTWHDDPPPPVREALVALCADVPYLGTTESPVRLTASTEPVEPTHTLDQDAEPFGPSGADRDIDAARPGRTAELLAAHTRRTAAPRGRSEAYGTDEWSTSEVPPRDEVEALRYVRQGRPVVESPWSRVILLPLSRAVPEQYRVRWAVAAHRALIHRIGEGAPALVTGSYPKGAARPANRLALHLLNASAPLATEVAAPGVLSVLLPDDAADSEVQIVAEAVEGLRSIRGPGGWLAWVTGRPVVVSGSDFWRAPEVGHLRLWRPAPAAVPDTRGSRAAGWTFTHAALLSLGFVWKRQLPPVPGRGDEYYRNLAQAVADAGAAVVSVRPVRTSDAGAYAHRVHPHAVVRPYTACVWLGNLATPTTVAAIGQSRHLGGGLLMPYDVPVGTPLSEVAAGLEGGRDAGA